MSRTINLGGNDFEYLGSGSFNHAYHGTLKKPLMVQAVKSDGTRENVQLEMGHWVCKIRRKKEMLGAYKLLDEPERAVRICNEINPPSVRAYLCADGWIMTYVHGSKPTNKEICEWLIDQFFIKNPSNVHRILRDADVRGNLLKTPHGEIVCIDPGLAVRFDAISSEASIHYREGKRESADYFLIQLCGYPDGFEIYRTLQALLYLDMSKLRDQYTADQLKTQPDILRGLAYAYIQYAHRIEQPHAISPLCIEGLKEKIKNDYAEKWQMIIRSRINDLTERQLWAIILNSEFSLTNLNIFLILCKWLVNPDSAHNIDCMKMRVLALEKNDAEYFATQRFWVLEKLDGFIENASSVLPWCAKENIFQFLLQHNDVRWSDWHFNYGELDPWRKNFLWNLLSTESSCKGLHDSVTSSLCLLELALQEAQELSNEVHAKFLTAARYADGLRAAHLRKIGTLLNTENQKALVAYHDEMQCTWEAACNFININKFSIKKFEEPKIKSAPRDTVENPPIKKPSHDFFVPEREKKTEFAKVRARMLEKIDQYLARRAKEIDQPGAALNFSSRFFRNEELTKHKILAAKKLKTDLMAQDNIWHVIRSIWEAIIWNNEQQKNKRDRGGDFGICLSDCLFDLIPIMPTVDQTKDLLSSNLTLLDTTQLSLQNCKSFEALLSKIEPSISDGDGLLGVITALVRMENERKAHNEMHYVSRWFG